MPGAAKREKASRLLAMGLCLSVLGWSGRADTQPPTRPSTQPPTQPSTQPPTQAPVDEGLDPAEPGELGLDLPLEDPSGHAMDRLHAALRRAERGEGIARLVFYGGSHTASDHYTGWIRRAMQQRFGDAGHGFLFPVPVVDGAWRWGLRIEESEGFSAEQVGFKSCDPEPYGLAGIYGEASEEGAFVAFGADTWGNGREVSHLEVMYLRRPGGGALEVFADGRSLGQIETEAEEQGPGSAHFAFPEGLHRFELRTLSDRPVRLFGVAMEREGPGVIVDNLGLVGSKARHHLLWQEETWRPYFASRRPDLWALAYGSNETTDTHLTPEDHEAHLRRVVERLRAAAPEASCLLIGPGDRPRHLPDDSFEARAIVNDLIELQRRVAHDNGCAFFDTQAFQGGPLSTVRWVAAVPPYARPDYLHFTAEGYHRLGHVLYRGLLEGYDER